jgi:two-component system sensor histidine kinase ChvG
MVFVWISNLADATVGDQMLEETSYAADRVEALLDDEVNEARLRTQIDGVARAGAVRIRLLDPDDNVVHDLDHEAGEGLLFVLGSIFFAADDAPTLAAYDAGLPAVDRRLEISMARATGSAAGCEHSPGAKLLVCYSARSVERSDGTWVIYTQESSRRAIRALYDQRYQLAKLTLFQVLFAGLLGAWLGWRMVRPVERLRRQVLDRTRPRVSTQPVVLDREDEIGDLAKAFNELLDALRQRNDDYQSFVEDLAHEMKNPVAAIRVAAERMDGPLDTERAQRLGRIITDSSQRLDDQLTRFLELARAEAGLKEVAREEVDLVGLVRGLLDVQDERYSEQRRYLDAPERAIVLGAPSQLETALRNIVDNAASFAGPGGVVRVLVAPGRDGWVVTIRDSGPGVEEADRERIFERFFTRRSGRGGTGLGLAMTRAVVEAHGGTVGVDPPRGGDAAGACFVVKLPKRD